MRVRIRRVLEAERDRTRVVCENYVTVAAATPRESHIAVILFSIRLSWVGLQRRIGRGSAALW